MFGRKKKDADHGPWELDDAGQVSTGSVSPSAGVNATVRTTITGLGGVAEQASSSGGPTEVPEQDVIDGGTTLIDGGTTVIDARNVPGLGRSC